jgi:hypothetical protein
VPYILQSERGQLDGFIDNLADAISNWPPEDRDGLVNYVITSLVDEVYFKNGVRYFTANRAVGVLTCVLQELYRRKIGPYEDHKMHINGDVYRATKV